MKIYILRNNFTVFQRKFTIMITFCVCIALLAYWTLLTCIYHAHTAFLNASIVLILFPALCSGMQWSFLYISLVNVLKNVLLEVLIALCLLVKILGFLVFLFSSLIAIYKGHFELEFRLKLSLFCWKSLLVFSVCLQISN